jgi:hypothetical protein
VLTGRYYRIQYTNGITPTTSFRIGSILSKRALPPAHAHNLEHIIDANHAAIITKSVVSGLNPLGLYVNTPATVGGALLVSNTDLFRPPVARHFVQFTGITSTLSASASSQDTSIAIQGGDYASFSVGDYIEIVDGLVREGDFAQITAKPGSPNLTLDGPLDFSYSSGSTVEKVERNLASTVASLGAPISYKYQPPANKIVKITTGYLVFEDNLAMDTSKFGSIVGGIINGAKFRVFVGGQYQTVATYKTNGNMLKDSTTTAGDGFHASSPGGANGGLTIFWRVADILESPPVLNGALGEFAEVQIQDNITANNLAEFKIHGVELLTLS